MTILDFWLSFNLIYEVAVLQKTSLIVDSESLFFFFSDCIINKQTAFFFGIFKWKESFYWILFPLLLLLLLY